MIKDSNKSFKTCFMYDIEEKMWFYWFLRLLLQPFKGGSGACEYSVFFV